MGIMTATRTPFSNRGYSLQRAPSDGICTWIIDPKGVAHAMRCEGHSFRVLSMLCFLSGGARYARTLGYGTETLSASCDIKGYDKYLYSTTDSE